MSSQVTEWGAPMRVLPDGRILTLETDLYNLRLTISAISNFELGIYDDDY